MSGCLENFLQLLNFFKMHENSKNVLFQEKKRIFHKCSPHKILLVVSARFILELKVKNNNINVAICLNSVALKIYFNYVKEFRDTKICRNFRLQEIWTKLRSEVCFLGQSFTKYFEANLEYQEMQVFHAKIND